MSRIIDIKDVSFDLENIKEIRETEYIGKYDDGVPKVTITLLRGKEYIYKPNLENWILVEPEIIIRFSTSSDASNCRKEIVKQWEEYLFEKKLNDLASNE